MSIFEKYREPVILIGGIILFFWIAILLEESYYESKDKEIDKKVTAICNVIRYEQPNNINLYDECWNAGMEQFGSENN